MTAREALKEQLDSFTDDQVQQIADFMAFLEFRTQPPALEDTPKEQVLADFRQAWHEAKTGQGIPVAQLWEQLENE
jgi:hypothetical protein